MGALSSAWIVISAGSVQQEIACLVGRKAPCEKGCLTGRGAHGCIHPPPVPDQCSFPRRQAVSLCSRWRRCYAINCAFDRSDCQARGRDHPTSPSFGDADVFYPRSPTPTLHRNLSHATCLARIADELPPQMYAEEIQTMNCSDRMCAVAQASEQTRQGLQLRFRKIQSGHRLGEAKGPPLLFTPVVAASADPAVAPTLTPLPGELAAYRQAYTRHYFMADSLYIWKQFFSEKRRGFFLEVGGLDGAAYGSNSLLFERYMDWNGLLIEASPFNFARLLKRRPLAYRLEGALGNEVGSRQFSGHGCCGQLSKNHRGYRVNLMPIGLVLRAMRITSIDFWSLDVSSTNQPSYPSALHDETPSCGHR